MSKSGRYRPKQRHKDQTTENMQEIKLQMALLAAAYVEASEQHYCRHEVIPDGENWEVCTLCDFRFLK